MFGYLSEMDAAVEAVIAELNRVDNRHENTVVIFSSDNGAPPAAGIVLRLTDPP